MTVDERPIPPLETEALSEQQREYIREWQADRGQPHPPGELWRFLVRSPDGMRTVAKLGAFARVGTMLPEGLRVAAVLSVVTHRAYAFEIGLQRANLERIGMAPADIEAISNRRFDRLPVEVATVSQFAYAMAETGSAPSDLVIAVRDLLGERGAVELGITTAYFGMISDIAETFGY